MNKQIWTWVVLIIIVLVVIFVVISKKEDSDDFSTEPGNASSTIVDHNGSASTTTVQTASSTPTSTKTLTPKKTTTTTTKTTSGPLLYQVKYLESGGYLPYSIKIKVGDIVNFSNVGSNPMWTISPDYPGHGINNCGTASEYVIFDQCRIGNSYSFKFNVRGVWTYYNKQALHHRGTVIVE